MLKTLVPKLLGAPKLVNQDAPRRKIVGATAIELNVVDGSGGTVEPHAGGKGRLHARHALFTLERFEHRRFFTANIGPSPVMDIKIERPAVNIVLADETGPVGLLDCSLEICPLFDEFAAHVNVGRVRAHGE